ncbi:MAG TPA: ATP-binding cassette domain-containing protein [Rhizobiaceae bacterium]|nr:ATP-binding cassette domain-containing protein [Rhizobiaceae bacterium]
MTGEGLVLERVRIALGTRELLSLDANVQPGAVLTVMGPSGSGKSSLLAFLGGFLDTAFTASGSAFVGGVEITALDASLRRAGILFQDPLLFPHMSVGGNLLFALSPSVRGRAARRERAEAALADIGLDGMFERDPATLSGGQKARVALARVLLAEPRLLLLDEPFSKLDTQLRQQVRELVFARAEARRLPVVLVTHDEADATAAGGRLVTIGD